MRKLLGVLAVAAVVVSLALPAVAQEVVSAKASRVTIGGYIQFDAAARDTAIFFPYEGGRDEHFVNTDISIELTIDMTDNVSAFIQLRDDWVHDEEWAYAWDRPVFDIDSLYGLNAKSTPLTPDNTWGNSRGHESWDSDYELEIEAAYIDVREFLVPELDMRIGIQNLVWDLRGNGDEFVLNVNEMHGYTPVEAGAWKATYDADPLMVEGFAATLYETFGDRSDKALYGGLATYPFDDMSKGQLGLLVYNNDSVQLYIVDVGVDYWLNEDTEIYGEAALNFGDLLAQASSPGVEIEAKGYGGYVGGMYTFSDVEWTPSIDLSFWYLSGDDDPIMPAFESSGDTKAFHSAEDVDTFAILEENHYGWDWESNYMAIKACGSAQPREDVTVDLKVGWFQLVEALESIPITTQTEEDLGIEVDASITWQYSENLSFTGLFAYLFGADALEEGLIEFYGFNDDDTADSGYLAALQTKLIF